MKWLYLFCDDLLYKLVEKLINLLNFHPFCVEFYVLSFCLEMISSKLRVAGFIESDIYLT